MNAENNFTVAIIPARLESSRLPGKALVDIHGIPMILHVFKRCLLASKINDVYVATDNQQIADVVRSGGGKVLMTRSDHKNGTERIAEAAEQIECEIIVNVFGDEALVNPQHIDAVVSALLEDSSVNVAILVNPYKKKNSSSDIKAVVNENMDVMYLSRADIPSRARTPNPPMYKAYHILPFRKSFLLKYAKWPEGKLEQIEYHEHLRILEKGYRIRAVVVSSSAVSVDTQEDLQFVREKMLDDPYFKKYKDQLRE